MTWNDVGELAGRIDWLQTGGVVALVLLAGLVLRVSRRKMTTDRPEKQEHTDQRVDYAIVMLVGLITTGVLAEANWEFFRDKLHITELYLLIPLFTVMESCLLLAVRSARRMLRWTLKHDPANASAGPAGKVLAGLIIFMSVVAASTAHNIGAVIFRLGMPLLALSVLLLQLWEERYRAQVQAGLAGPTGLERFLPEWALVLLGRSDQAIDQLTLDRLVRQVAQTCRRLDHLVPQVVHQGDQVVHQAAPGWFTRARVRWLRRRLERRMNRAAGKVTIEMVQRLNVTVYGMEAANYRLAVERVARTWDNPAASESSAVAVEPEAAVVAPVGDPLSVLVHQGGANGVAVDQVVHQVPHQLQRPLTPEPPMVPVAAPPSVPLYFGMNHLGQGGAPGGAPGSGGGAPGVDVVHHLVHQGPGVVHQGDPEVAQPAEFDDDPLAVDPDLDVDGLHDDLGDDLEDEFDDDVDGPPDGLAGRERAVYVFSEAVGRGERMTQRALAAAAEVSPTTAARAIREVDALADQSA